MVSISQACIGIPYYNMICWRGICISTLGGPDCTGRDEAGKVGYNCLRTGLASGGAKGPACCEPRWQSLRPHSASAALDRQCASASRNMGEAMRQVQVRFAAARGALISITCVHMGLCDCDPTVHSPYFIGF